MSVVSEASTTTTKKDQESQSMTAHTVKMWVQVEASSLLTLMLTLHWWIWDALKPEALHSSSSCSLFRLASIRSSSSSSPWTRRLLSPAFKMITRDTEITYMELIPVTVPCKLRQFFFCATNTIVWIVKEQTVVPDRAQGRAAHNSLFWPSKESF